jgi:CheY-like chemotaxis protein
MITILVIDDDANIRYTVEVLLRGDGYDVISACDGNKGLQMFDLAHPNLVITDILMPDRDGIETIREIKKRSPFAKVIAMSGGTRMTNRSFLDIAHKLGADRILAKPFHASALSEIVADTLAS